MAMMAAAPAAEAVAGRAAAGAAASSSAGTASKASKAGVAKAAAPTGTAAGRASQLANSGTGRGQARRVLMDEFGGTGPETDRLLDDAYGQTAADSEQAPSDQPAKAPRALPSVAMPKSATKLVNAGGGALLGAFTYVLALCYLRDGKAGVTAWLRAKFLNDTTGTTAGARTKADAAAVAAKKRSSS